MNAGAAARRPRRGWSAALAALAFALAFQGVRPLWEPDEGRYVDVALEMLRLGDFWTPRLHHDVPHYTKPPLTYWTLAASIAAFGRNEWAARLPNALAFASTILLVGATARRLAPESAGAASVVYATSLLPFVASGIVTTDTLLAACAALGAYGYVELRWGAGDPRRAQLALWGGFGLAFLVKGPPGLLPLAGLLAGGRWGGPAPRPARRLLSLASLLLFGALALGWFAHEVVRRPDLLSYLLGAEVYGRVATPEFDRNDGVAGLVRTYAPVVLLGMLPWWPLALRRRPPSTTASPPHASAGRFLAIWIGLPLVVFCLSRSRLPLYLLPLTAPAAIAIARRLPPRPRGRRAVATILAWSALLLSTKALAAGLRPDRDGRLYARELLAAAGRTPREVVFVERRPLYTLAFYLGCEVELLDLAAVDRSASKPAYRPLAEPLGHEIHDPGEGRVFIVPDAYAAAFVSELAGFGLQAPRIGRVRGDQLFGELARRDR